ncbi:histidine phosphatase family protein [uncultured Sulfitobacter sp.]|uniref:histidine phosphatase family protein n=1 Tax=uncultured Sulfitobacter sp. TaxID=191468 RepID=UPI0026079CC4|nr:histidine phosphatase family protein [uncultured Sulfitobacter sp.]
MEIPPLYVLRHAETEWNVEGRLQGALDAPLTPRGLRQAEAVARTLRGIGLDAFSTFCSPQGRAVKTARIALAGHPGPLRTDARLREIGIGDWAGRLRRDLDPEGRYCGIAPQALQLYEDAPGGEGFDRLHARCKAFLEDLREPCVIVTHSITSRMLRVIATGGEVCDLAHMPCGQGIVFHIENRVQNRLD